MNNSTKILTALIATISISGLAQASAKIGIINEAKVFEGVPQGQAKLESLKEKFQEKGQELVTQQKALQKKIMKFQKNESTMTKDEDAKQSAEIKAEQDDFQKKAMEAQQHASNEEQELESSFQTEIDSAINEVSKKDNYSIVLSSQAAPYISESMEKNDITNAVISKMNIK
tara:strand:- start:3112 stop:3627 length:516 start_codon:yes stop_codon:yes gene_type:complete